jgi:hypothetical protein
MAKRPGPPSNRSRSYHMEPRQAGSAAARAGYHPGTRAKNVARRKHGWVPSRPRSRARSPRSDARRPEVCTRLVRHRSCVKSGRNADAATFNRLRQSARRHERSRQAEVVARPACLPGTDSNAGSELSSVADLNPEIVGGCGRRALIYVGRIDRRAQSRARCFGVVGRRAQADSQFQVADPGFDIFRKWRSARSSPKSERQITIAVTSSSWTASGDRGESRNIGGNFGWPGLTFKRA